MRRKIQAPFTIEICAAVIWKRPNWPSNYTHFLDTLNGMRRVEEIRRFRALDYGAKRQHIFALMDVASEQIRRPERKRETPR